MSRLTYGDMFAEVMEHFCEHDAHGYSQINREGDGTVEHLTLSDGTEVDVPGGDTDCSEGVRRCIAATGVIPFGYWSSYMWTGNEVELLEGYGFVEVPLDEVVRGDVLWRPGHTEIYLGGDVMGGARRSENGGIDGYAGDQDGWEVAYGDYRWWEWDLALRYPAERPDPRHIVPDLGKDAVYRMHNPYSGTHHFTTSRKEAQSLSDAGWSDEGLAWRSASKGAKVRRLYNPHNGLHLLTVDDTEAVELVGHGWAYEGVAMFSGGDRKVHRLYNRHSGEHMYTTSTAERDALVAAGWKAEGDPMRGQS